MWMLLKRFLSLPLLVKRWVMGLGGVVTLFAAFKLYVLRREQGAVKDFKTEQLIKVEEVKQDARKAVAREKADVDGVPDSDLVDRLRRRTGDWGRL